MALSLCYAGASWSLWSYKLLTLLLTLNCKIFKNILLVGSVVSINQFSSTTKGYFIVELLKRKNFTFSRIWIFIFTLCELRYWPSLNLTVSFNVECLVEAIRKILFIFQSTNKRVFFLQIDQSKVKRQATGSPLKILGYEMGELDQEL